MCVVHRAQQRLLLIVATELAHRALGQQLAIKPVAVFEARRTHSLGRADAADRVGRLGDQVCPRCTQPLRLVDAARARHLQGLVGEYALVRAYYHCAACSQGDAPLDAELGLGPGALSPGLSRVACRLGIEEAFAPAAEVLWETLQVAVPAESVRRITEGLGAVAEAEQQAAMAQARGGADPPLPAEPPAQLVVAVDGVMVHIDVQKMN